MFKFLIAKCPIDHKGGHTSSDWWQVETRHKDYDCAEDSLTKITYQEKVFHKFIIFKLKGYQVGEQFNIKAIQARHKA